MPPKTEKPNMTLDPAKIRAMAEPLQIVLDRVMGESSESIPMPALVWDTQEIDPAGSPGSNWNKVSMEKVMWWVRDYWSGGGSYRGKIIDANGTDHVFHANINATEVPHRPVPKLNPGQPSTIPSPSRAQAQPIQQPAQAPAAPAPPPAAAPAWPNAPVFNPATGGWQQPPVAPAAAPAWPQQQPQMVMTPWGMMPATPQQGAFPGQQPYPGYGMPPAQGGQYWPSQQSPYPGFQQPGRYDLQMPSRDLAHEDRMRALEAQLAAAERDKRELAYQSQIRDLQNQQAAQLAQVREEFKVAQQAQRPAADSELAKMRADMEAEREKRHEAEMQRLREQVTMQQTSARNPELEALKEQNRILGENQRRAEEKAERDREAAAAREREALLREEMRKNTEAMERRMAEMSANKGPDPVLSFMQENQRNTLAMMERQSTQQQLREQQLAAQVMTPMQTIELMKGQGSDLQSITKTVLPAVTDIIGMYRSNFEHLTGLSGGGGGGGGVQAWLPGMIQDGLAKASDMWGSYNTRVRDTAVTANKAEIAKAEAEAVSAQARAQEAIIRAQQQGFGAAQHQHQLPQQVPMSPLPQQPAQAPAQPKAPAPVAQGAPADPAQTGQVLQMPKKKTDADTFGLALPQIQALRTGVVAYLAANEGVVDEEKRKTGPKMVRNEKGEVVETNEVIPVGISPPQAADLLLQGVEEVQKHPEVEIPAFRWFLEQNWAIFADVVFPDSMGKGIQAFKEVFIAALVQFIEEKKTAEQPDPQLRV